MVLESFPPFSAFCATPFRRGLHPQFMKALSLARSLVQSQPGACPPPRLASFPPSSSSPPSVRGRLDRRNFTAFLLLRLHASPASAFWHFFVTTSVADPPSRSCLPRRFPHGPTCSHLSSELGVATLLAFHMPCLLGRTMMLQPHRCAPKHPCYVLACCQRPNTACNIMTLPLSCCPRRRALW